MSKELPSNPNPNEEIDLGQIFIYIEKIIKKTTELLSKLFKNLLWFLNKVLVFIIFSFNVFLKNIVLMFVVGAIGFGLVYFMTKTERTEYYSNILINQNFKTGKVLYSNIGTLNNLASSRDSIALSVKLGIAPELASQLSGFSISHRRNKNVLIEDYIIFKKRDTSITISFEEYLLQENLEDFSLQSITVRSFSPDVYKDLEKPILELISKNKYFNEIKKTDSLFIIDKINVIESNIVKADSLKDNYIRLLNNYYGQNDKNRSSKEPTINLNLSNNKDKINTKEYDLLEKSNQYRSELTDLKMELRQKENLVDLLKEFSLPMTNESKYEFLGKRLAYIFVLIAFFFLILKEIGFKKFIENYGSKDKLFNNENK